MEVRVSTPGLPIYSDPSLDANSRPGFTGSGRGMVGINELSGCIF